MTDKGKKRERMPEKIIVISKFEEANAED